MFRWTVPGEPCAFWDGDGEEIKPGVSDLEIIKKPYGYHIERDVMPAMLRILEELCERADPPRPLDTNNLAFRCLMSLLDERLAGLKVRPRRKKVDDGFDIYFGGGSIRDVMDRVKSIDLSQDPATGGIKLEVRYK